MKNNGLALYRLKKALTNKPYHGKGKRIQVGDHWEYKYFDEQEGATITAKKLTEKPAIKAVSTALEKLKQGSDAEDAISAFRDKVGKYKADVLLSLPEEHVTAMIQENGGGKASLKKVYKETDKYKRAFMLGERLTKSFDIHEMDKITDQFIPHEILEGSDSVNMTEDENEDEREESDKYLRYKADLISAFEDSTQEAPTVSKSILDLDEIHSKVSKFHDDKLNYGKLTKEVGKNLVQIAMSLPRDKAIALFSDHIDDFVDDWGDKVHQSLSDPSISPSEFAFRLGFYLGDNIEPENIIEGLFQLEGTRFEYYDKEKQEAFLQLVDPHIPEHSEAWNEVASAIESGVDLDGLLKKHGTPQKVFASVGLFTDEETADAVWQKYVVDRNY